MLALPLRLPTASYGGHMGHFLLSTLALMGSTPLANMASLSVELNSKYLVQDRPHKLYEDVIPALGMGLAPTRRSSCGRSPRGTSGWCSIAAVSLCNCTGWVCRTVVQISYIGP